MKATTNNANNASKRTAAQINAILRKNNFGHLKAENLGDGRDFSIMLANDETNRAAMKALGFILPYKADGGKTLVLRAY